MKFYIARTRYTDYNTSSNFTVSDDNGNVKYNCVTVEDVARPVGVKVPKKTCIPEGDYKIALTMSARFGKLMPLIYNQPDFTIKDAGGAKYSGVRLHPGNTEVDTDACVLPGLRLDANNEIEGGTSRPAFEELLKYITTEPQPLTIKNFPQP